MAVADQENQELRLCSKTPLRRSLCSSCSCRNGHWMFLYSPLPSTTDVLLSVFSRIGFFLSNIHIQPRCIWLTRHAESGDQLSGARAVRGGRTCCYPLLSLDSWGAKDFRSPPQKNGLLANEEGLLALSKAEPGLLTCISYCQKYSG